jgi:CRP-like cAMP-binding protein
MDQYVVWAFILGGLSAISLLIGSLIGVSFKIPKSTTGLMAAFGAGALLSALAIELVAPTISSFVRADASSKAAELHHFLAMVAGCFCGGLLFVLLDQLVNQHGGYLRKTAYAISRASLVRASNHKQVIAEIANIPLFYKLDPEHMDILMHYLKPRLFVQHESIFTPGDPSELIYIVRKGSLYIDTETFGRVELGRGEIVGEVSFLAATPHTANCTAADDVELLTLNRHDFQLLTHKVPEFVQGLKDLATQRLDQRKSELSVLLQEKQQWANLAMAAINHGQHMPSLTDLKQQHGAHSSAALAIWLGILLDGIPESFVIGTALMASIALKTASGAELTFLSVLPYTLIAGLFLSNLPEALSSSAQMRKQGMKVSKILLLWTSLVLMTAIGAAIGAYVGEHVPHGYLVFVEGLAAGAMLTMICAAMLPEAAHLASPNLVGLFTLIGFLCSILFKLLE